MWEEALNNFILNYQNDEDVEASLLVGSYAVKNNNKYRIIIDYIAGMTDRYFIEEFNVLKKI